MIRAARDIERRIKQKHDEVQQLRESLSKAEAYIEAMSESLRLIRRTESANTENGLRPGSMVYKAREILQKEGRPLYIGEILTRLGKQPTKGNRVSLSGSLGSYVRDNNIFTRPAPNTFGLVEFSEKPDVDNAIDIPDDFGLDNI